MSVSGEDVLTTAASSTRSTSSSSSTVNNAVLVRICCCCCCGRRIVLLLPPLLLLLLLLSSLTAAGVVVRFVLHRCLQRFHHAKLVHLISKPVHLAQSLAQPLRQLHHLIFCGRHALLHANHLRTVHEPFVVQVFFQRS